MFQVTVLLLYYGKTCINYKTAGTASAHNFLFCRDFILYCKQSNFQQYNPHGWTLLIILDISWQKGVMNGLTSSMSCHERQQTTMLLWLLSRFSGFRHHHLSSKKSSINRDLTTGVSLIIVYQKNTGMLASILVSNTTCIN